jgi:predicted RNase H-like HicB family nuclease
MNTTVEYIARVHQESDGSYWAEVLNLPGCFASGHTLDELREGLEEAISLYVADDPQHSHISSVRQIDAPHFMTVDEMRVSVPC